jgi:hypothetical protein
MSGSRAEIQEGHKKVNRRELCPEGTAGLSQQEHHRCKSFSEEYVELLKRFNVPHDQRYIFQPVDPD